MADGNNNIQSKSNRNTQTLTKYTRSANHPKAKHNLHTPQHKCLLGWVGFQIGGLWHDAMVCCSRLQLAAPTGRCAVLCCAVLCCAVLCCAVLCCAVLWCVVSLCIPLFAFCWVQCSFGCCPVCFLCAYILSWWCAIGRPAILLPLRSLVRMGQYCVFGCSAFPLGLSTHSTGQLERISSGKRCTSGKWLNQYPSTAHGCWELVTSNDHCDNTYFSWADSGDHNCWCATPGTDCASDCTAQSVVSTWRYNTSM